MKRLSYMLVLALIALVPGLHCALQSEAVQPRWEKLGRSGNHLPDSDGPWHCVLDRTSRLVWENKSDLEGPRYASSTYTWFDRMSGVGTASGGSCLSTDRTNIQCDTDWLIQIANEQRWCGKSDWRLPTKVELLQLVHPTGFEGDPQIAYGYFQHTARAAYWTSDVVRRDGQLLAELVHFQNGEVLSLPFHTAARVRLVSGRSKP